MEVADGRVVTLEYTVHLASGVLVDSTGGCGPVTILCGSGKLLPAIESRLGGIQPGETRELRVPADEAYGPRTDELVCSLPRDRLPPDLELTPGKDYRVRGPNGRVLRFRLLSIGETEVQADFNPPQAGQELIATVTVVSVRAATPEEERRGVV